MSNIEPAVKQMYHQWLHVASMWERALEMDSGACFFCQSCLGSLTRLRSTGSGWPVSPVGGWLHTSWGIWGYWVKWLSLSQRPVWTCCPEQQGRKLQGSRLAHHHLYCSRRSERSASSDARSSETSAHLDGRGHKVLWQPSQPTTQ